MSGIERRCSDGAFGRLVIGATACLVSGIVGWMLCEIKLDKQAADAVKDRPYLELTESNDG